MFHQLFWFEIALNDTLNIEVKSADFTIGLHGESEIIQIKGLTRPPESRKDKFS